MLHDTPATETLSRATSQPAICVWRDAGFGRIAIEALARGTDLSDDLCGLVSEAVTRLLDSEIIIESAFDGTLRAQAEFGSSTTLPADLTDPLDDIVETIRKESLNPHLLTLLKGFSRLTHRFFVDERQQAIGREWAQQGFGTLFMMTDGGGPALANWNSVLKVEDGVQKIHVDKCWIMGANKPGFGIVAVRAEGAMYPIPYLLSPQQCGQLAKSSNGAPFLGGVVHLGAFKGTVEVTDADRCGRGGFTMINQLLTTVRPFFVRAVLAHVRWLHDRGDLNLTTRQRDLVAELERIGHSITDARLYSNLLLQQVLALKLACNELLMDIIVRGNVRSPAIARDLQGFGKMEGSSYRCFRELYGRATPPRQTTRIALSQEWRNA
ncbi:hypothetical protein [Nguyenibacter vanlangensis]|uniref:Acyl-CoA dehydrogenase n=1 Tax=Nguyenibacter vanlangensis TaxID=1216886 RepID=A0A7Y7ITY9_9PROT|nr:hypothetical protein [Nguyenibacter vanlangensis]NVN09780.1 hypothetical protein [Nguyenibacter vanlangensis]